MARMGRAAILQPKYPSLPSMPSYMSGGGGSSERGQTTEEKLKESYSWLKDAYTFAKANKDHLEDPDVKSILQSKLFKLEKAGYFTPSYRQKEVENIDPAAAGLSSGAGMQPGQAQIAGPGAGTEGQLEVDPLKTLEALQSRFMMDNPNIYKPTTQETMGSVTPGGPQVPGTMQTDPMLGKSQFFEAPPEAVAEGKVFARPTVSPEGAKGVEEFGKIAKTATPLAEKEDYSGLMFSDDLGRWIQKSPEGKIQVFESAEELADKHRANHPLIPNSVYNNNLNQAIKDAVEGAEEPGMLGKVYNWLLGKSPETFEELIKPRLDEYNKNYMESQGKEAKSKTTTPSKVDPKKKVDSILFGPNPTGRES